MRIAFEQLEYLHPTLRKVLSWLEFETGFEFTNTSNYRPGDNGVHGQIPVRGWDIRCRNRVLGQCIVDLINGEWVYDPNRPFKQVAIAHGKDSNYHIHIQVHPNTIPYDESRFG